MCSVLQCAPEMILYKWYNTGELALARQTPFKAHGTSLLAYFLNQKQRHVCLYLIMCPPPPCTFGYSFASAINPTELWVQLLAG